MSARKKISNRIAAWRLHRRLTQEELGHKIGVSGASIRAWESGTSFPNPIHLARLCTALRCSQQDLYACLKSS